MNVQDVLLAVSKHGMRPKIPETAPAPIATLIKRCWKDKPRSRPSMVEIHTELCEIQNKRKLKKKEKSKLVQMEYSEDYMEIDAFAQGLNEKNERNEINETEAREEEEAWEDCEEILEEIRLLREENEHLQNIHHQ